MTKTLFLMLTLGSSFALINAVETTDKAPEIPKVIKTDIVIIIVICFII